MRPDEPDESERDSRFPLSGDTADAVTGELRDSVSAHTSPTSAGPAIVSISDIHGYLDAAQSALLTLRDHPDYDPVVERDESGDLRWADNDYVLVFNGDLVDRGPANVDTVRMVARLASQAPPGRVRVTLGNHEMGILAQALFRWERWFSGRVGPEARRSLVSAICRGHVVAAYEGYGVTYVHAGQNQAYTVPAVNDALVEAVARLDEEIGGPRDARLQRQIVDDHPRVLGMGSSHPKGPDSGLVWLDFEYLQPDAPPQVVGHTRYQTVTQKGAVICENVIRNTIDTPGGEAVLVEDPTGIVALRRDDSGAVSDRQLVDV